MLCTYLKSKDNIYVFRTAKQPEFGQLTAFLQSVVIYFGPQPLFHVSLFFPECALMAWLCFKFPLQNQPDFFHLFLTQDLLGFETMWTVFVKIKHFFPSQDFPSPHFIVAGLAKIASPCGFLLSSSLCAELERKKKYSWLFCKTAMICLTCWNDAPTFDYIDITKLIFLF